MTSHSMIKILAVVMTVWLPVAALACKDGASAGGESAEAASPPEEKTGGPGKGDGAGKPDAKEAAKVSPDANAPPENLYPGFNFGLLPPAQRALFVRVAESELCPCPNSAESLHQCLQKMEGRCGMAEQVAGVLGMSLQQGLGERDAMARVAEFVQSSKRVHEFNLDASPVKGDKDAPIVIVEFADFTCPHCKEASQVLDKLVKKHGQHIRVYYKMFPLGRPEGQLAAIAAAAAHRQGKFWPMHDLIFQHQRELSEKRLEGFAQQIGLNMDRFKGDMKNPEVIALVQNDRQEGEKAGIQGTPELYINGRRYLEDKSEERITQVVEALVREQSAKK